MAFLDALLANALPYFPRSVLWRVGRRYIAGEFVEDALNRVGALNEVGIAATLDILGEDVRGEEPAEEACRAYCDLLERVHAQGLRSGISVKLSQLGLLLASDLAQQLLERVVATAADHERFVRIDMEDSSLTSSTLRVYADVASRFSNVGIVLQACLRRSLADLDDLFASGLRPDVRICKGIYRESPEIAFEDPDEIRANFLRLLERVLQGGGRAAVATHDPALVRGALERLESAPDRAAHEFQMLLGVGDALRPVIVEKGWRLRVYVPFGTSWHAYSLRRLRENPAIAGYVLRDLLHGVFRA